MKDSPKANEKPYPLAIVGDRCGEGLTWDSIANTIYWTDIDRFLIHSLGYPTGVLRTWIFEEPVTALSLSTEEGRLLVALASKLIWWWPESDKREDHGFVLPGSPRVRFNDGRTDPAGNFWIGTMFNNLKPDGSPTDEYHSANAGALYRIFPDGTGSEQLRGIGIGNTLCWTAAGTVFYFADTLKNEIRRYPFGPAAKLGAGVQFFKHSPRGLPDGSAIDEEGCIWNARYGGSCVIRISPDGEELEHIEIPTRNITTCAFGGPDLQTLFITSAANAEDSTDKLAGTLWALKTDVKGLPERRVKLA